MDYGFARWPKDEKERQEHGFVVYHPGVEHRMIQADEFAVSLSGSEEGKGGRPAQTHSNPNLPEAGKPVQQSSVMATVMVAFTFGCEPIPPLFILPSKAKQPRINVKMIQNCPYLDVQLGMKGKHPCPPEFAYNRKAGMNGEFFKVWADHLKRYWPDMDDAPGKRVLLKSDGGPGRSGDIFLVDVRRDGLVSFPGLPNGSEDTQEADQLIAAIKAGVYRNRDSLYAARCTVGCKNPDVRHDDLPLLLMGGTVEIEDGTVVELENSYLNGLTREKIKRAKDKCGYHPSTHAALSNERIRISIGEEDAPNECPDPYGELCATLEAQNKKDVEFLEQRGYKKASTLRRELLRVTTEQSEGRERGVSFPDGSRELQDALAKTKRPGEFFRLTNGGAPMNCDMVLIGKARQEMLRLADKEEARKHKIEAWQKHREVAYAIFETDGVDVAPTDLIVPTLKSLIRFKQGPYPKAPNNEKVTVSKGPLIELWISKYHQLPEPKVEDWTDADDENIETLRAGDVGRLEETELYKRSYQREQECLATRLGALPLKRSRNTILRFFGRLSPRNRQQLLSSLQTMHETKGAYRVGNSTSQKTAKMSKITTQPPTNKKLPTKTKQRRALRSPLENDGGGADEVSGPIVISQVAIKPLIYHIFTGLIFFILKSN